MSADWWYHTLSTRSNLLWNSNQMTNKSIGFMHFIWTFGLKQCLSPWFSTHLRREVQSLSNNFWFIAAVNKAQAFISTTSFVRLFSRSSIHTFQRTFTFPSIWIIWIFFLNERMGQMLNNHLFNRSVIYMLMIFDHWNRWYFSKKTTMQRYFMSHKTS